MASVTSHSACAIWEHSAEICGEVNIILLQQLTHGARPDRQPCLDLPAELNFSLNPPACSASCPSRSALLSVSVLWSGRWNDLCAQLPLPTGVCSSVTSPRLEFNSVCSQCELWFGWGMPVTSSCKHPRFLASSNTPQRNNKFWKMCLVNCSVFEGPACLYVFEPQAAASTQRWKKFLAWHQADVGVTRSCWEQEFAKSALLPKKLHKIFCSDLW